MGRFCTCSFKQPWFKNVKEKTIKDNNKTIKIIQIMTIQYSNCSIYILLVISNLQVIYSIWEVICREYANASPFDTRNQSIPEFWYPRKSWNQSLMETERGLYLSCKIYCVFYKLIHDLSSVCLHFLEKFLFFFAFLMVSFSIQKL